jgi:hypothetical protein
MVGVNGHGDYEFCINWIPKVGGNYSHISLFEKCTRKDTRRLLFRAESAVGGTKQQLERECAGYLGVVGLDRPMEKRDPRLLKREA